MQAVICLTAREPPHPRLRTLPQVASGGPTCRILPTNAPGGIFSPAVCLHPAVHLNPRHRLSLLSLFHKGTRIFRTGLERPGSLTGLDDRSVPCSFIDEVSRCYGYSLFYIYMYGFRRNHTYCVSFRLFVTVSMASLNELNIPSALEKS
jgi:hypothetical protein